jgi:hypothetical protein
VRDSELGGLDTEVDEEPADREQRQRLDFHISPSPTSAGRSKGRAKYWPGGDGTSPKLCTISMCA